MAGSTTVNGLPYPSAADPNNVPADLQALAESLDGGSVVRRLSQSQIDALTGPQRPTGLVVYNLTAQQLQVSTGSGWHRIPEGSPRIAAGSVVSSSVTANVTFPSGLFTAAPFVTVSNGDATSNGGAVISVVPSPTATGCVLKAVSGWTSGNWRANWTAVQP